MKDFTDPIDTREKPVGLRESLEPQSGKQSAAILVTGPDPEEQGLRLGPTCPKLSQQIFTLDLTTPPLVQVRFSVTECFGSES